jgi:colanic acid/amylovoran biosynthesis glycosyltransferase
MGGVGVATELEEDGPIPSARVAYITSRFPKLTETFVLYEILAVEDTGVRVELYPLHRERQAVAHPEADALTERAHFLPLVSPAVLATQLWWLWRRPRAYLSALWAVARGTWGSANFFLGGLAVFPKSAHAARRMLDQGVSHVHCHFANHPTVAGFVVSRLADIPFSFTAHGHDLHVERRMLCAKLRESAFAVTVSEYNRSLIARECPSGSEKVRVVHCGVDTDRFRPRATVRPSGPLHVVCVGTLHEVKGQRHLLDALVLLRRRGVAFRCDLVGEGPDRRALEDRASAGDIAGEVRFAGALTRDGVADLLACADVVVAPSVPTRSGKREGIPVALMEAMSSGAAVVASDLSGIPELVEHGVSGLLVPCGDASAIADALAELAADPERGSALGRAGRARVQRDFDLRRSAATLAVAFTREGARCR